MPVDVSHTEERTIDYVFRLLDIPWWYYLVSMVIGVIVWRIWKNVWLGLLTAYVFLILSVTLLTRMPYDGIHYELRLFWSYAVPRLRDQIIFNVIAFIPVGVLAGRLWKWKGIWVAAGLSVVIEVLQLITGRGLLELDDIFHNCLGAVVGIGLYMAGRWMVGRYKIIGQ